MGEDVRATAVEKLTPGGMVAWQRPFRYDKRGVSGTATCELDCIWVEPLQTFFALDLLSWKGHRLLDCPAEFRLYWLHAKLQETRAATASYSAGSRGAQAHAPQNGPIISKGSGQKSGVGYGAKYGACFVRAAAASLSKGRPED